jgi:acyl carrier protein
MATSSVESVIKEYILGEFLQGEDSSQLDDTTPLITSGIMDSIRTLKLVAFLEERFSIALAAHEADADHLDTIAMIAALVRSKQ